MDRRQFLQLSSMAALSLYASRLHGSQTGSSPARPGPAKKVTILGAGIAGLAAGDVMSGLCKFEATKRSYVPEAASIRFARHSRMVCMPKPARAVSQ